MTDQSSSTFEAYADELVSQLDAAKEVADLDECTSILKQMTLEARSLTPKQTYLDRCLAYKSKIQVKKLELERVVLIGSAPVAFVAPRRNDELLAQQNIVLTNAMRTMHETEDVAAEIAANLHSQRTTIENTQQNTQTLSSLTSRANQIADNLLKPWWKKALSK